MTHQPDLADLAHVADLPWIWLATIELAALWQERRMNSAVAAFIRTPVAAPQQ